MPRNFDFLSVKGLRRRGRAVTMKDPRMAARLVLGLLLAANVAAALIAFRPWGGSPEDLARQVLDLRAKINQRQLALERTKTLLSKVEKARSEGDQFLQQYTLARQSAYSSIAAELDKDSAEAGIKPKGSDFALEAIEGSDTLDLLTISAVFEASYANLTKFINLLDRSPLFLIIDSLQAAPQQSGILNVGIKVHAIVREESGAAQGGTP